ncbi:IS66 family insertion sequence element accessory protein TnpB [Aminobacter sp. BA135]|uniref:IS66 family insertion sequence element accessory protein TnpB n=5 Tax=Phyllobacteriaceae TaxID=69277 RepID=UPI003D7B4CCB
MSAPMPDDRSFHVLEAVANRLEASPQRPRRRWSAEAKSRLIEATLKPGANVSAIARQAGMAPAQLFGWRSKAIKSGAVTPQRDADRLGFVEVTQAAASSTSGDLFGRCGHSGRRRRRPGSFGQDHPGGSPGMIPAGVKVLVASHPVDFPDGLLALVRDAGSDPFNGALYVFRAKRADRIKIVWWDGSGVCLYAKRLDDAKFCWPRIGHHRVQLNHAQLMALVDGMDWKRVRTETVRRPQSVG